MIADINVKGAAFTADDVYKAIADGLIAFDLHRHDISETNRAFVFRDQVTLEFHRRIEESGEGVPRRSRQDFNVETGTEFVYEGQVHVVMLVGTTSVVMKHDSGTIEMSIDVLRNCFDQGRLTIGNSPGYEQTESGKSKLDALSPAQVSRALARARLIELAQTNPSSVTVSKRSIQRYKKLMREAGTGALEQNLALVSRISERGNRERKISTELIELIRSFAEREYNTPVAITKEHAFILFTARCQEMQIQPCSKKTFFKELDKSSSVRAREGKRKDYQESPIVWYLKCDEPIHGVRPFQYVHIDHTPLEIILGPPGDGDNLGRPWLSLAIDAESRAIVGFYLSFEPPSYRSCMMVLRDLVRRYGRMPDMVITDNGKEFHSISFSQVCHLYRTNLRFRPAGQPRHGSVMERVFGTSQSQLIHNLEGNTKLMKHVRTVTKSVNPENFVKWTLPALHGALDYYFRVLYGTDNHPAHDEGPEQHLLDRLVETGVRRNRWIRYDHTFMIETCPSVDLTGTRIVDIQRGIKINHIWYWTDAFRNIGSRQRKVQVRVDPWDVANCYVLLGNHWHKCASKLAVRLRGYTEIELRYAFQELVRKHGIKKKDLTPERIAEWARVLDAANFDPRLRIQQAETRLVYDNLGMTAVADIPNDDPHPGDLALSTIARPRVSEIPSAVNGSQEKVDTPIYDADNQEDDHESGSEYELF